MSDEGPDDMLPSTSRDRLDGSGHRLEFMIGDNVLPYDMTVYQAVQQFGSTPMFDMTSGTGNDSGADPENRNSPGSVLMYGSPGIWARIHTIYYRPIPASGAAGMSSDTLNANMSGKLLLLFSYMNIYMFFFYFSKEQPAKKAKKVMEVKAPIKVNVKLPMIYGTKDKPLECKIH